MLTLPRAIATVGLIPGVLLVLISASAAMFGLYLLSESARYVGRTSSFFSLCRATYPDTKAPAIVFDIAIALKCFGVSISYLILVGESMNQVMLGFGHDPDALYVSRAFWTTAFMAVIAPLAFLKRLDSMKYTSFLALFAVVYLVYVMISSTVSPFEGRTPAQPWDWGNASWGGVASLPIFIFAFTCHQNIFSVFNELRDNGRKPMRFTIGASVGISTFVYKVIGLIGYFTFGAAVSSNILANMGNGVSLIICRILLTILFVFSYSLQAHPARASIDRVIKALKETRSGAAAGGGTGGAGHGTPSPELSTRSYLTITSALLICSYVLAIKVANVSTVLGFVGSTASVSICYILPGLFYFRLKRNEPWDATKIGAAVLFVAGCVLMPLCLSFKILGIFGYSF